MAERKEKTRKARLSLVIQRRPGFWHLAFYEAALFVGMEETSWPETTERNLAFARRVW